MTANHYNDATTHFHTFREEKKADGIECHFCSATKPTVSAACDAGWIPGFYMRSRFVKPEQAEECCDPVCESCQKKFLVLELDEPTRIY